MITEKALIIIGNGSAEAGEIIIDDLAIRLTHAREKHPAFAPDYQQAAGVIYDEACELYDAPLDGGLGQAHDEAYDVLATAIRFINK